MQQYTPNLGQLCGEDARRDAVHIAVAPVVADATLLPGNHVGLLPDGRASRHSVSHIGIVDPFLKDAVHPGQTFWLFLYQNSITGLRHVWTHFAFAAKMPREDSHD